MAVASKPRWSLLAPSERGARAFLARQQGNGQPIDFSYPEVGASRHNAERPHGYDLDHNRVRVGDGPEAFTAACEALRTWRMFPAPWTRIFDPAGGAEVGNVVVMQARAFGVWWLNACRVVYALDERGPVRRWGFAYGTLPAHVEQGEERFSVELHPDGGVWYDLRAFSRPRYWPVRLAKPLVRRLQARFVRESQAAMQAAVARAVRTAPLVAGVVP